MNSRFLFAFLVVVAVSALGETARCEQGVGVSGANAAEKQADGHAIKPRRAENGRVVHADFKRVPHQDAKPLTLRRPGADEPDSNETTNNASSPIWALIVVLILVVGTVKLLGHRQGISGGGFAEEAFDVLGRKHLDNRNSILLVRVGDRLILVGVSQNGLNSLGEITDPIEVERITNLTKANTTAKTSNWLSWKGLFKRDIDSSTTGTPMAPVDLAARHRPPATSEVGASSSSPSSSSHRGTPIPTGMTLRELEEQGHV